MLKKITNILLTVFSVGIIVCLFAGGLSLVGYVVAMFIGGETATEMCLFIFKTYLPWVIKFTTIFTAIGLLAMYLSKTKALTVSASEKNEETNTENSDDAKAENETENGESAL